LAKLERKILSTINTFEYFNIKGFLTITLKNGYSEWFLEEFHFDGKTLPSWIILNIRMNKKLKLWELDRVSEAEFKSQEKFPIVVILDSIRSLNNIGSFFRTSDAFNVEKIYLCGITAVPPHRDIQKTALGATDSVSWEYRESIIELIEELKEKEYKICSIEQAEKTTLLQDVPSLPKVKYALIFGNEVDGVDQEAINQSDYIIEIPQFGTKHSLNVSVCAGVILWEFAKREINSFFPSSVN
jgi:23S rRNA (guanosine2251-2'-O)-methyltransferase